MTDSVPVPSEGGEEKVSELDQIDADRERNRREGFYEPLPATPRLLAICEAMKVLLDPEIPYEHAYRNHNCGECWSCIHGTITLTDVFRKEGRRA